jgi:hypothetical protein
LRHQLREIMRTLEAAALVNATDPLPRCILIIAKVIAL